MEELTSSESGIGLVARQWWLAGLGLILGVAAAVAYLAFGPRCYASTAYVQVNPAPDGTVWPGRGSIDAAAAEAEAPRLLAPVADALSATVPLAPADLGQMLGSGRIVIRDLPSTNQIAFTAVDRRPSVARAVAAAFAATFVADANRQWRADLARRHQQLDEQIQSTQRKLADAQVDQRRQDLERQIREQRDRLLQLQTNYLLVQRAAAPPPPHEDATGPGQGAPSADDQRKGELEGTARQLQARLDDVNARLGAMAGVDAAARNLRRWNLLLAEQQANQATPAPAQLDNAIARTRAVLSAARVFHQQLELQAQVYDLATQLERASPTDAPPLRAKLAEVRNQLAGATDSFKASGFAPFDPVTIDVTLDNLEGQLQALLDQQARQQQRPSPDVAREIQALQGGLAAQATVVRLLAERQVLEGQLMVTKVQLFEILQARIEQIAAGAVPTPTPGRETTALTNADRSLAEGWLASFRDQQTATEKSLAALTAELAKVQRTIAERPGPLDPDVASALAAGYSRQVQDLAREDARVQAAVGAPVLLTVVGEPTEPLPQTPPRWLLGLGGGLGLIVGALGAGLLELRRRQRIAAMARLDAARRAIFWSESRPGRSRLRRDGSTTSRGRYPPLPLGRRRRWTDALPTDRQ